MDGQKFAAGLYLLSLYPLECKRCQNMCSEDGGICLMSGIISVIGLVLGSLGVKVGRI